MKFETLVKRYKNIGYTPKGLEKDLEVESIIKWLYDKYDIYIYIQYHSKHFVINYRKIAPDMKIKSFVGHRVWNCSEGISNTIYSDNYFDNPYDAKFDTLREIYRAVKFRYNL